MILVSFVADFEIRFGVMVTDPIRLTLFEINGISCLGDDFLFFVGCFTVTFAGRFSSETLVMTEGIFFLMDFCDMSNVGSKGGRYGDVKMGSFT